MDPDALIKVLNNIKEKKEIEQKIFQNTSLFTEAVSQNRNIESDRIRKTLHALLDMDLDNLAQILKLKEQIKNNDNP